MSLLPRIRVLLARRPWIYWLFVAACAAAVWLSLSSAHDRAEAARDEWGTTVRVWVAAHDLGGGEPIVAVARDFPPAMVPAAALVDSPVGAAAHVISRGEVLVSDDVSGGGSLAPAGWLVFAVPADATPSLVVGDTVAAFGSGQRWCDGVVTATGETTIELAVAPDCAAALSAQLALGAVTLARG